MTTIARYNALRRELLQVELDLAASKRAYLEDGTTGPRGARAALEERRAALRLEIHDVRALVELLPAEQREVVMLRYFSGLSFKDIAEQTEVSINTALGRMRYALINLRRMIKEKNLVLS